MENEKLLRECKELMVAYKKGELGYSKMPEDTNPGFSNGEERLVYFTLPMSLNYQRDSYKLWESVLKTYNDKEANCVFNVKNSAILTTDSLRKYLTRYKLALQPNKHIQTWQTISKTIYEKWGSIEGLLKEANFDYLELKKIIQREFKKGFPYLSGPKIFNYWCFILREYGKIKLTNDNLIEIAPDTHVTQCSIKLGVINQEESLKLSKEEISKRWKEALKDSGINPIDMHPPLWFWSRNNFSYKLKN